MISRMLSPCLAESVMGELVSCRSSVIRLTAYFIPFTILSHIITKTAVAFLHHRRNVFYQGLYLAIFFSLHPIALAIAVF